MDSDSLLRALQDLYKKAAKQLTEEYERSLPFADTIFRNRWERAKELGFSDGASIYDSALVFGDVTVDEHTWIGPMALLDGSGGGIKIGKWCSISSGVQVYTHDTVLRCLSGGILSQKKGSVSIGDYCYIGSQSIIANSVKIGPKCVVAANSFVNKDVPERTIVGGSPASILGEVVGDGADVTLHYQRK